MQITKAIRAILSGHAGDFKDFGSEDKINLSERIDALEVTVYFHFGLHFSKEFFFHIKIILEGSDLYFHFSLYFSSRNIFRRISNPICIQFYALYLLGF